MPPMSKKKKIIIAEDDQMEQGFIREGFEQSGHFEVISIEPNGHKLVGKLETLAKQSLPDVILSDINMPLMTGLEALVKVKNNPTLADIPFVIFSTSKEESTEKACYNLGADKFLLKPSTFNDYKKFALNLSKIV
jgi:CheY-like chemotaxis protein